MTPTETTRYAVPRDAIEASRRRARRLRTQVVSHLVTRAIERLFLGGSRPATTPIRPTAQPA